MSQIQNPKYDLEARTYEFAVSVRDFVKGLKQIGLQLDNCRQRIRSSGSVAANYIEANESLSRKNFLMRAKICRKEAKESILWLKLLNADEALIKEATELMKIFGAIIEKTG